MAQVKVYFDPVGQTLTVWFADPQQEHVCEETGEEIVLMKDSSGRVIGFEKLHFSASEAEPWQVIFERISAHVLPSAHNPTP